MIRNKLIDTAEEISDETVIDHLLDGNSLRDEFDTICSSLYSAEEKPRLPELVKRLTRIESRDAYKKTSKNPEQDNFAELLSTSRNNKPHHENKYTIPHDENYHNATIRNPNYVQGSGCDYHRTVYHPTSECYTLKRKRQDEEDMANSVECFHCHTIGHRAFNCPKRRAERRIASPKSSRSTSRNSQSRRTSNSGSSSNTNHGSNEPSPATMKFDPKDIPGFDYAALQRFFASEHARQVNSTDASGQTVTGTTTAPPKPTSPSDSTGSSASDLSQR
ncbi:hypothetical protein EDC01DRAFT_636923 [Geopyxis carbonaria]|nr:hypothetical protein EDC01DRAFT_636923 [Geopyxis carbonaria]